MTSPTSPTPISIADIDVYARAFEAPGAMRALCEIYRELDHDAEIHRADLAAHGKLTVPILASGGGAQTLAANYAPMCEEVGFNVTGHLVPAAGHWVPEENPAYLAQMFLDFDAAARAAGPATEDSDGVTTGERPDERRTRLRIPGG